MVPLIGIAVGGVEAVVEFVSDFNVDTALLAEELIASFWSKFI